MSFGATVPVGCRDLLPAKDPAIHQGGWVPAPGTGPAKARIERYPRRRPATLKHFGNNISGDNIGWKRAMATYTARPFLKWAGGKAQLLDAFTRRVPRELSEGTLPVFVEPFVGGGAVYFHFNSTFRFRECHIFDINEELILTYRVVKNDVCALIDYLAGISDDYLTKDDAGRKDFYYAMRDTFNRAKGTVDFGQYGKSWIERAAQLIFLNRTCFNGLYRVNLQGGFNVPFGRCRNPTILNEDLLRADA